MPSSAPAIVVSSRQRGSHAHGSVHKASDELDVDHTNVQNVFKSASGVTLQHSAS